MAQCIGQRKAMAVHGLSRQLLVSRVLCMIVPDRLLHRHGRFLICISSGAGLDHVLGYAYHGTTGRCSWASMGMLDWRMNQNVRTCAGCQIARGRTPQVARDGLGWVWRRPRQLSEADGLLRLELSQMMAPTFPGSLSTLCLAALAGLEAQPRDYQQEY